MIKYLTILALLVVFFLGITIRGCFDSEPLNKQKLKELTKEIDSLTLVIESEQLKIDSFRAIETTLKSKQDLESVEYFNNLPERNEKIANIDSLPSDSVNRKLTEYFSKVKVY